MKLANIYYSNFDYILCRLLRFILRDWVMVSRALWTFGYFFYAENREVRVPWFFLQKKYACFNCSAVCQYCRFKAKQRYRDDFSVISCVWNTLCKLWKGLFLFNKWILTSVFMFSVLKYDLKMWYRSKNWHQLDDSQKLS